MKIYKDMKIQLDYNDQTGKIQNTDPYLVCDNGTITKILNHQKLHESITYYIGPEQ